MCKIYAFPGVFLAAKYISERSSSLHGAINYNNVPAIMQWLPFLESLLTGSLQKFRILKMLSCFLG